jgi:hypothetical protein
MSMVAIEMEQLGDSGQAIRAKDKAAHLTQH